MHVNAVIHYVSVYMQQFVNLIFICPEVIWELFVLNYGRLNWQVSLTPPPEWLLSKESEVCYILWLLSERVEIYGMKICRVRWYLSLAKKYSKIGKPV